MIRFFRASNPILTDGQMSAGRLVQEVAEARARVAQVESRLMQNRLEYTVADEEMKMLRVCARDLANPCCRPQASDHLTCGACLGSVHCDSTFAACSNASDPLLFSICTPPSPPPPTPWLLLLLPVHAHSRAMHISVCRFLAPEAADMEASIRKRIPTLPLPSLYTEIGVCGHDVHRQGWQAHTTPLSPSTLLQGMERVRFLFPFSIMEIIEIVVRGHDD